jgi:hypothetical protein
VLQGLGIRAGDGASRATLMAAVGGAMAAWAPLTTAAGSSPNRGHARSGSRGIGKR